MMTMNGSEELENRSAIALDETSIQTISSGGQVQMIGFVADAITADVAGKISIFYVQIGADGQFAWTKLQDVYYLSHSGSGTPDVNYRTSIRLISG